MRVNTPRCWSSWMRQVYRRSQGVETMLSWTPGGSDYRRPAWSGSLHLCVGFSFLLWPCAPSSHTYSDTTRRGVMSANLTGETECSLRVLEADISPFNLNETRGIWADVTGVWDGIVICFDVTDGNSSGHVEDLLRESTYYAQLGMVFSRSQRRHLQSRTLCCSCMQIGARTCCMP